MKLYLALCLVIFTIALDRSEGKLKEGECEVCVKFLTKFEKTLEESDRKDQNVLTEKLKKACRKAKNKENRFCYYVGGTDDSATYVLKDITKPLAYFKGIPKICEDLQRKDKQICDLQYDKELDWKNINLKKMRVKELKKILNDWDEKCSGCVEKSDYVKKIEEVKNQHVEL